MSKNKTRPTLQSPTAFLATVEDQQQRADCMWLMNTMQEITGQPPVMWGDSIVGFGSYHYVYASGREGDSMETGFSPRKGKLSIYLMSGIMGEADLLTKLGKHRVGKSCLYVKRLTEVDTEVLREMIQNSVEKVRAGEIRY